MPKIRITPPKNLKPSDTPDPTLPKYVKLNLPGAPTMMIQGTTEGHLHCVFIRLDFGIWRHLANVSQIDAGDLIPCHANGEPLEPHETQDGRYVQSSWTWDEDDREWVSNTGSSVGRHSLAHDGDPARNLFACVGRDVAFAKFDEWAFEARHGRAGKYTNLARESIIRGTIELFDRDGLQPAKELDVIDLLTRVPDARQNLQFDRPPSPWAFEGGAWRRWHGDDVEQVLDEAQIEHRIEKPRLGYLFGTLVAQVGEREALGRARLAQAHDPDKVPDKGDWIPAGNVTRAMLDTCPIWEENTNGHIGLWLSRTVDPPDLIDSMWRPLRLSGMGENGVIAAADMTQECFDRVPEWQWRDSESRGWHSLPGNLRKRRGIQNVGQHSNEKWRPATVALGSRHVGEKSD